jgi:hypothetical protein
MQIQQRPFSLSQQPKNDKNNNSQENYESGFDDLLNKGKVTSE